MKRADLTRPGVRVLNRGGFANADVLIVPVPDGPAVVVKDYGRRSFLARRILAPWLVRHELEMLECLAGLPGIPASHGRIDDLALAMEYIDGIPLRRRSHSASLSRAFFDGLEGILDGVALRGVIYMDLRSSKNVLSTRATDAPALVDLASAYRLCLPRAWIRSWDQFALRKLRKRFEAKGGQAEPQVLWEPTERYRELDLGSLSVSYLDRGPMDDPTPVLFLHDAGHSTQVFRAFLDHAEKRGRRAIGLDLPGFGDSPRRRGSRVTLPWVSEQVGRFCEAMRLGQLDLVAHGFGGLVARNLASSRAHLIRALVTLDTPLERADNRLRVRWKEARRNPERLRRRLLREWPAGLDGSERRALGHAIQGTRASVLQQSYRSVRLRRVRYGALADEFSLRGVAFPDQPWLAVFSDSPEAARLLRRRPLPNLSTDWWSRPFADPARLWDALERLTSVSLEAE